MLLLTTQEAAGAQRVCYLQIGYLLDIAAIKACTSPKRVPNTPADDTEGERSQALQQRPTCRPRRVQLEKRVFGIHPLHGAGRRLRGDSVAPPHVAASLQQRKAGSTELLAERLADSSSQCF